MADPIDAYLDELERGLDLPVDERAAVREEIGAHLLEERWNLIAEGLDPEAAATEAIRRQGDALVLGHALTRARQSRRALLAAAGAGTWAAARAAVGGWIIGAALLVVVLSIAGLALALAVRAGAVGPWAIMDQGWYLAVGVTTLWFAAWAAGRALVSAFARRAHRRAERVRVGVTIAGSLVVAWLVLVWLRGPQNLASVVALVLVPIVFAGAAWTGTDRPVERSKKARYATLGLVATLVIALPLLALAAAAPIMTTLSGVGSGPYASQADLDHALGFDMAGRAIPDGPQGSGQDWSYLNGVAQVTVEGASAVTTRWHDLRVEAWRATFATGGLDRAYQSPFATALMSVTPDGSLKGSVRVDGVRGVTDFSLVVTGVASDGQRDLIASLGGTNTSFTGSVLGWLTAP